ncbi:MAG: hypothetical protein KF691_02295 [Phycisphaeraceae bacterium]|nr:hypothetical protein [Phycisphaeraceae bacterium]
MPTTEARAWFEAIQRPSLIAALEAVYVFISDQIEARGPACWASGRCCNFREAGHLLYTTGIEVAYCMSRLESPLTSRAIEEASANGGCAFQLANVCGVHAIKPSGCRVYFCDRSAQAWQNELTERAIEQIKRIHKEENIEYRYGEWNTMLRMFV